MTYAPSRFWYAVKDGTAVKKYDTAGETLINLPDEIEPVAVESRSELDSVSVDTSVLTGEEMDHLGVY